MFLEENDFRKKASYLLMLMKSIWCCGSFSSIVGTNASEVKLLGAIYQLEKTKTMGFSWPYCRATKLLLTEIQKC